MKASMTVDPVRFIVYPWIFLAAVWVVTALAAKRSRRIEPSASRILHLIFMTIAFALLFRRDLRIGELGIRVLPQTLLVAGIGFALTILGAMFAIWARIILGGNWSGVVSVKEDHVLVRRGPYQIVRHPIYAGGLLAMLGTALVFDRAACFLAVLMAFVGWWFKAGREEQFMMQEFGDQYRLYREQVKQLIPFVL